MPYSLPLTGYCLFDVQREWRFELLFDDPAKSRLWLEGPFSIVTTEGSELYEPPCAEWVRDVLLSLAAVKIVGARFNRQGVLRVSFADGRELLVEDGPYENWHYSNDRGVSVHGGVGGVTSFGYTPFQKSSR